MAELVAPTRAMIEANKKLRAACPWYNYFATPELRRGYAKHAAFMAAGKDYRQRLFLSANRSGKTATAAFEMTCHLTGAYPTWWEGRRFQGPIEAWAGGDTGQTVRDIIQVALLGPVATMETQDWCGMLPKPVVYNVTRRPGLPGAASAIYVARADGKVSVLGLLSYDQGRETWQGTAKQVIWEDEEPPDEIHGEALMRTMTTGGIMMVTMTPLKGLTPFVGDWLRKSVLEVINPETGLSELRHAHSAVFAEGGGAGEATSESAIPVEDLTRYTVMASWDDCPHLGDAVKAEMAKECPPHLLDARRSGVPSLGSGTIFPIPESEIRVKPFEIPDHWPRCWGADTDAGAGWTAAIWLAWDREANVYYLYDGFKRRHAEPAVHIDAIKARGVWIPGVADAAGLAVTARDSEQVISIWKRGGLDVTLPKKSPEAAIQELWELLSGGRFKVFSNMGAWFDEYRLYRRDDKGRVVKKDDHYLDATLYACVSGRARMKTKPGAPKDTGEAVFLDPKTAGSGWMGA